MNRECLTAYRAGAKAMLAEVAAYLPAPQLRELEEWVELDLANAVAGRDPPLPPSRWHEAEAPLSLPLAS